MSVKRRIGWNPSLRQSGVLCAADVQDNVIASAYMNGSIKFWHLDSGVCCEDVRQEYTNDEDIVTSMCTSISLSKWRCAAGFQNGDFMVWKRQSEDHSLLSYMSNYGEPINSVYANDSVVCVTFKHQLRGISHVSDAPQILDEVLQREFDCQVESVHFLHTDQSANSPYIVANTKASVTGVQLHGGDVELDRIVGDQFTSVDADHQKVVSAISCYGYSILGGYRVRLYDIEAGKQTLNLHGNQTRISCLRISDQKPGNHVVAACSDGKLCIHDLRSQCKVLFQGITGDVSCLQMDEWKIAAGFRSGTVCLWDRRNFSIMWQTQVRHPVALCQFTDTHLITANIPVDKYPQNSYWNADDLIQHRKHRGAIRIMDFTQDNISTGVPDICHADYDNIAGYDYNIELIAPYDDVNALNLPKI